MKTFLIFISILSASCSSLIQNKVEKKQIVLDGINTSGLHQDLLEMISKKNPLLFVKDGPFFIKPTCKAIDKSIIFEIQTSAKMFYMVGEVDIEEMKKYVDGPDNNSCFKPFLALYKHLDSMSSHNNLGGPNKNVKPRSLIAIKDQFGEKLDYFGYINPENKEEVNQLIVEMLSVYESIHSVNEKNTSIKYLGRLAKNSWGGEVIYNGNRYLFELKINSFLMVDVFLQKDPKYSQASL